MLASLKALAHQALQKVGYDLVNTRTARPVHMGSERVLGSYPPFTNWWCVGKPSNYFIHDGYRHRPEAPNYDATGKDHLWQWEVYKFAREICDREGIQTVCDIGCGSGFKLMKNFRDVTTVGIEIAETCRYLRKQWPDRQWMIMDPNAVPPFPVEMVISADVIEHLPNPNELLAYIEKLEPRYVVISSPDRNLLRFGVHDGPPMNPTHTREWSFAEFHAYIGSRFEIEEHFISFPAQATQCILCRSRQQRGQITD
jgi:hypothetical protein